MQQMVDDEIAGLIAGGQLEKAFRLLLKEFKRPLYFMLREMLSNHSDTDDVLQNTFVKVWQNLSKFQGKSKVYSWCYRIAVNECLQWIAKNKKHQHTAIENVLDGALASNSYAEWNGDEITTLLQSAVKQLPEQQKRVFELKYFENKKYTEIATELNLSAGGLKANYHHAVKKIEAYIKLNAVN